MIWVVHCLHMELTFQTDQFHSIEEAEKYRRVKHGNGPTDKNDEYATCCIVIRKNYAEQDIRSSRIARELTQ